MFKNNNFQIGIPIKDTVNFVLRSLLSFNILIVVYTFIEMHYIKISYQLFKYSLQKKQG